LDPPTPVERARVCRLLSHNDAAGQRQRPPAGLSALPVAPGPVVWLVRALKLDCCGLGAAAADGAGSGTLRDTPHRPLQRVSSSKDPAPPRPQHNQGLGHPP